MKLLISILSLWAAQARLHQPYSRALQLSIEKQAAIDVILKPPSLNLVLLMGGIVQGKKLDMCEGNCYSEW